MRVMEVIFSLRGTFQENCFTIFCLSHALNDKVLLKFEYDTTADPGKIGYAVPKSDYSFGMEYNINDNFSIGIARREATSLH